MIFLYFITGLILSIAFWYFADQDLTISNILVILLSTAVWPLMVIFLIVEFVKEFGSLPIIKRKK